MPNAVSGVASRDGCDCPTVVKKTISIRFLIFIERSFMWNRIYTIVLIAAVAGALLGLMAQGPSKSLSEPAHLQFTADNRLEFPADYREWIFLSAGKGMTYGPAGNPNGPALFDKVFVNPVAYREFLKSGQWPDHATFVLEIRGAATEGSINHGGQFQKGIVAVEVEVKDKQRFTETNGWAFFGFGDGRQPVAQVEKTQDCYSCHRQNGAVDQTFVQFYRTLIDIAKAHKTFRDDSNIEK